MKKAQGAGGAAALVAIIAGLIILYILVLPASEREALLNSSSTSTTTTTTVSQTGAAANEQILVFEHPGTLDPMQNKERIKALDSFNLYTEKTALALKTVDAVHVENGWFRGQSYNFSFKVNDLNNTDNYVLAFDVATEYGRLIITLNGNQIYDSEVAVGNAQPIMIDREMINSDNSLVFSVSDVGAAFWSVNEYDLKNVRMIADFTDVSKKQYQNFFVVSSTEKNNLDTTELSFVPDCLTTKVGPLTIAVNDRQLPYTAIPDCGSLARIPFDPNYLTQGQNTITFRAEQGNYFIDHVNIMLTLKEIVYPFYYFGLSDADINSLSNSSKNITLQMRFADTERKTGQININGQFVSLDTSNATYARDIEPFVSSGQNYLQVVPITNPLNIVDLKVSLFK